MTSHHNRELRDASVRHYAYFMSGFLLIIQIVLILIFFTIWIVCDWKIFEKAGRAGWKSIIPFYNIIVFLDIIHKPWWWILLFFIPIVDIVIYILFMIELGNCFGKDTCFKLGLIFLPLIFLAILAFDNSQYIEYEPTQTFVSDAHLSSYAPRQEQSWNDEK